MEQHNEMNRTGWRRGRRLGLVAAVGALAVVGAACLPLKTPPPPPPNPPAPAQLQITPANESFTDDFPDASTQTKQFTVENVGGQTTGVLGDSVVSGDPEFSKAFPDNCDGGQVTLAPQASCTISVAFTASATSGTANGQVSVSGTPGGTATASLDGVMTETAPASLSLTPGTTLFHDIGELHPAGTAPVVYTLTNTGGTATGPLAVSANVSGTGGNWNVEADCHGQNLPPAGQCSITIAYTAFDTTGSAEVVLLVTGATVTPFEASFLGMNLPAIVALPLSLNLVAPAPSQQSAPEVVTITNNGSQSLASSGHGIANATGDGFFALLNGAACSGPLPPGASCTIDVAYTAGGSGSGTADLYFNGVGITTVTVLLNGSTLPAPSLSVSPNPVFLLANGPLEDSTPVIVTIQNNGPGVATNVQLGVSTTSGGGSFQEVSRSCGADGFSLAASTSCAIQLKWTAGPTTASAAGQLSVSGDNFATIIVPLQGVIP